MQAVMFGLNKPLPIPPEPPEAVIAALRDVIEQARKSSH